MTPGPEYVNGVDVSLIRWSLSLTPSERLDVLGEFVDLVLEARKQNEPKPIPGNAPDIGR